jgi:hypothetical protein
MEDVDNQFTLCKGPSQCILVGEACLHDDANAKEPLNKVLQKLVQCTLTTYALTLRNFANFVEN